MKDMFRSQREEAEREFELARAEEEEMSRINFKSTFFLGHPVYMTMHRLNLGKSENLRNKYLFGSVEQTKAMKATEDGAMEAPGTPQLGRLTSLTTGVRRRIV